MKALARYALDVDYPTMAEDTAHIIVPLEVNDLTKGFTAGFYGLLDTIGDTAKAEGVLRLAVARAEGFILASDGDLDVLVTSILNAVLASVGYHKASSFYQFFSGGQAAWEIREPVLSEELDRVKTWVGPLLASSDPVLKGYGDALQKKIAEADQHVVDLAAAEQALREFKEIGARKQLVDSANALRAQTYGALNQLLDAQPAANLPHDLADRAFRYERLRRHRQAPTSKDIARQIAANEKEHAALLALLATTQAAEAAAAKAKQKAKLKPAQDALASARKKAADLAAHIEALEAKLPPPSAP